jgi:peptide/nickel transport system ATP-binding protein
LIEVRDASRVFAPRLTLADRISARLGATVERRSVMAVDRVSLHIERGEVLALVGESGCGKSTLGRLIAGILAPSGGSVRLDGAPVMSPGHDSHKPRKITTRVQTIFQDPQASLDPRMRVGVAIAEGPIAHGLAGYGTREQAAAQVAHELERVGLAADAAGRYPHQFSGGQRQRIAIARALAMRPDVLVCDEPVASLDVSIQAQVLNLLLDLRRELQLTMLFISHHLGVVRHVADRVAVMYLGRIVECAPAAKLYEWPQHPYTQALLASVPPLVLHDGVPVEFTPIAGELPSPLAPPSGCHFHPRCPHAVARCKAEVPLLLPHAAGGSAACHLLTPI